MVFIDRSLQTMKVQTHMVIRLGYFQCRPLLWPSWIAFTDIGLEPLTFVCFSFFLINNFSFLVMC